MRIRMIKDWQNMRKGQTYDYSDGAANLLIARGYAKKLRPLKPKTKK